MRDFVLASCMLVWWWFDSCVAKFHPLPDLFRAVRLRDFLLLAHTSPFISERNCYCSVLPVSADYDLC
ncbi:MAG: hypothetical protein E7051_00155 [Lentisphaerae bacterium]|nr:hypothetical protein [Lentisphaerota bacterium]